MSNVEIKLKELSKKKLEGLSKGLLEAGLRLQAYSQEIVPVEHGDLKRSASTRVEEDSDSKMTCIVSYSAPYAMYVHEIPSPDATHGREYNEKHAERIAAGKDFARGDNQTYKFLEKAFRENKEELIGIIRRGAENG